MRELDKLDKAIDELDTQANQIKEFSRIYKAMADLRKSIESSDTSLKEITGSLNLLSTDIEQQLQSFSSKVNEVYQDQKNFFKELDSSLSTRLEKQKSDLQLEIRNEITQLERTMENFLESRLRTINDQHKKRHRSLVVILIFVLLISLLTVIGIILQGPYLSY